MPKATIGDSPIDQAQRTGVAVWEDALRSVLGNDIAPTSGDLRDSLFPCDTFKCAAAFWANAPHRVEYAVGMIDAIQVTIDLGTEPAFCHRMIGAPAYRDSPPLFIYLCLQCTTVGAIMGTRAIHDVKMFLLTG